MGYTYILVIWTIVGYTGNMPVSEKYDWRPIGEFYNASDAGKNAQQMCEEAARQLALKPERYRCLKSE